MPIDRPVPIRTTRTAAWRLRPVLAVLVALAVLGTVSACSSAASSAASGSGHSDAQSAGGDTAASNDESGTSASVAGAAQKATDRSVTVTGTLSLRAKHPIDAATAISQIVTTSGGRVANLVEDPKHHASAKLTVRIPAASFSGALAAIEREGTVTNVSVQQTDVTSQVTDYAVRIATLQKSIGRLQGLLARASTSTDLVDIETTLEQRETSLEQLLAQQKTLADAVSYATVSIAIASPAAVVKSTTPTNFGSGLVAGFLGLVSTAGALSVILGVVLPWVVVLGVLGLVVLVVVRVVRRRGTPKAAGPVA